MLKRYYTKDFIFKTLCFLMLFLLLLHPQISINFLKQSAEYAIISVAPAIFPYMIMAYLISTGRFSYLLGIIFYPITGWLLKINTKKAGTVLFVALIGGFAAAAVVMNRLIENKEIDKTEAECMFPLILIPSLPFIILVVGKIMYQSYYIGILFAVSTVTANILSTFLLSLGKKKILFVKTVQESKLNISEHITSSIKNATVNTVYICGFISFFGMLSGLLQYILPRNIAVLISAALEFSTAIIYADINSIYLVLVTLSWLGICSFFQVALILKETAKLYLFVISRLLTSLFGVFILNILFNIFPIEKAVLLGMNNLYILPYQHNIELSALAFLIIIVSFTDFISKKGLQ